MALNAKLHLVSVSSMNAQVNVALTTTIYGYHFPPWKHRRAVEGEIEQLVGAAILPCPLALVRGFITRPWRSSIATEQVPVSLVGIACWD